MTSACKRHDVEDLRRNHAAVLPIPTCPSYGNKTFGAWSEGAGGFIYVESCALEVANYAANILDEDPDDTIKILAVCSEHEEQPHDTCEECFADEGDEPDDEGEA